MTADVALVDGEIVPTTAPITLFGTDNPVAVVERASTIATALADVIKTRHLYKHIGQSDHVFVEGWTLLGSMLGVFAEIEWSRPVEGGWEARAVARTLAGRTVGAAESMCSRAEGKWKNSDDYAMRSMAQTRAVSKALRLPLGFIMELAGYSATPAEEMTPFISEKERAKPAAKPEGYRRSELIDLARAKGLDLTGIEQYADLIGIAKGTPATEQQMDALIDAIGGHGTEQQVLLPDQFADLPEMPT